MAVSVNCVMIVCGGPKHIIRNKTVTLFHQATSVKLQYLNANKTIPNHSYKFSNSKYITKHIMSKLLTSTENSKTLDKDYVS